MLSAASGTRWLRTPLANDEKTGMTGAACLLGLLPVIVCELARRWLVRVALSRRDARVFRDVLDDAARDALLRDCVLLEQREADELLRTTEAELPSRTTEEAPLRRRRRRESRTHFVRASDAPACALEPDWRR